MRTIKKCILKRIWRKKKRDLFGEDADKIWSGDMLATEVRKAKMQDVMAVLNKSGDTTLDEKLEVYRNALNDTYKGTPEEFFLDQKEILSRAFFSIDSVQDVLKQMSSERTPTGDKLYPQ
ncbi:MAG: hypothetical protein MZV70_58530 [Desulfobacterales bacterium]|nr:hypothetical protein [Desulfobacterales bacterium]